MTYKTYCDQMKERKHSPMSEAQFNEMMNISNEPVIESLYVRERNQRPVNSTFENHEKKNYAPKIPRKGWTKEQIAARKAENMRRCRERKHESNNN